MSELEPRLRIVRLTHVNLSVDDVEAAKVFYTELLGLAALPREGEGARAGVWLEAGGVELHLSLESGADNARSKRHVAFEVESLKTLRTVLEARALAFQDKGDRLFVRDPSGNRLEFAER